MTTTANRRTVVAATAAGNSGNQQHQQQTNNSVMAPEPEEDIAAIAKQISDHAEAIYQTWKARGLAPNEILTCHRDSTAAADKFGSALTPQPKQLQSADAPQPNAADYATSHHLHHHQQQQQHTNSLERLVNKFVVEDKARLQAARQSRSLSPKPFASSIQYALQKFEQKATVTAAASPEPAQKAINGCAGGAIKTKYGKSPTRNGSGSYPEDYVVVPATAKNAATSPVTANTNEASPSWPFRSNGGGGKPATESRQQHSDLIMDEVALEEQRLIDALKNGSVIESDHRHHQRRTGEKPAVPSKEGVHALRSATGYDSAASTGGIHHRSKPEFLIGLSALSSSRRNQHAHRQQEQVPHPELTDHQRANIRSNHHHHQSNPVRPFLTRGSVAERVLIFEKCPTELMKNSAANAAATQSWKNIGSDVHGKIQVSVSCFYYVVMCARYCRNRYWY